MKWRIPSDEKGVTLVEILAAITILALIVLPLLSIFIQSAKTGKLSNNIMTATYEAQTQIEKIYHLSRTTHLSDSIKQLKADDFHYIDCEADFKNCFAKHQDKHFIVISIQRNQDESPMVDVVVKVFKSRAKNKLEAQMEDLVRWKN